jgi:hypothetical protein
MQNRKAQIRRTCVLQIGIYRYVFSACELQNGVSSSNRNVNQEEMGQFSVEQ